MTIAVWQGQSCSNLYETESISKQDEEISSNQQNIKDFVQDEWWNNFCHFHIARWDLNFHIHNYLHQQTRIRTNIIFHGYTGKMGHGSKHIDSWGQREKRRSPMDQGCNFPFIIMMSVIWKFLVQMLNFKLNYNFKRIWFNSTRCRDRPQGKTSNECKTTGTACRYYSTKK